MFVRARLIRRLRRLARLIAKTDQADRAEPLVALAAAVRADPAEASRNILRLYEGRDGLDHLATTIDGRALRRPGREWREAVEFARVRWEAYELALALWHRSKRTSPLAALESGEPIQKLADYGGGNQIWRRARSYLIRYDVGSHISKWRDDTISRRQAEQAVLGTDHFGHLVLALQHGIRRRGGDPNQGDPIAPPDPA
jgi:hypothetical protein